MGEPRIMVAVDPDALNALREELAALRNEIRGVRMEAKPEWLPAADYAKSRGVTPSHLSLLARLDAQRAHDARRRA